MHCQARFGQKTTPVVPRCAARHEEDELVGHEGDREGRQSQAFLRRPEASDAHIRAAVEDVEDASVVRRRLARQRRLARRVEFDDAPAARADLRHDVDGGAPKVGDPPVREHDARRVPGHDLLARLGVDDVIERTSKLRNGHPQRLAAQRRDGHLFRLPHPFVAAARLVAVPLSRQVARPGVVHVRDPARVLVHEAPRLSAEASVAPVAGIERPIPGSAGRAVALREIVVAFRVARAVAQTHGEIDPIVLSR